MNRKIIRYILGTVCRAEGLLLLLPCVAALYFGETEGFYYLITSGIALLLSLILARKKPDNAVFFLKEGCIATALSWIMLSVLGCLPFVMTGEIPYFHDALFETISGFTTTGSSILSDVEALSRTSLLWRSFTHWIGGMGVLVFVLAVVPLSGGSNMNLMRAESPGPSVGKLVPKLTDTAKILYVIYFVMTIVEIILLAAGGMPFFDNLCLSFGTAGTGGFAVLNTGLLTYTPYQQWIITIFMILFGVNFNFFYFLLIRRFKKAFMMSEVRTYFIVIVISSIIIALNTYNTATGVSDTIRNSFLTVGSIITTTGYASVDFNLWPTLSKVILVFLMFCGACAGSTGGGIKVSRLRILFKSVVREVDKYYHPRSVKKIKEDGETLDEETVRSVGVYMCTFIALFAISLFIVSFEGRSFETSFTSVTACINNIGPGLGDVGPTGNFGDFSLASKIILMIDMLAGRLELYPLILLLNPSIYTDAAGEVRANIRKKRKLRKGDL
ncbi:MAG: TrkH family potassium uptake protein [Lachnospiraceae bacterium]|nr:TrkH family potassium uptake protein [Lachnospiraceae bacterium]